MSKLSHAPLPWTAYEREDGWWEIDHAVQPPRPWPLRRADSVISVAAVAVFGRLPTAAVAFVQLLDNAVVRQEE